MKAVFNVFLARLREFYRDPATLLWNFAFPILLIVGFYFIFNTEGEPVYRIGVVQNTLKQNFKDLKHTEFINYESEKNAIEKIRRHKIDILVKEESEEIKYWVNTSSPKAYFAEKLLLGQINKPAIKQAITGRKINYLEWVFPGIVCMNLMFSCLWGVGYVIVKYRQDGYLKRLNATPLKAISFLSGQLMARMVVSLSVSSIILFGGLWSLGFQMHGNYLSLFLLFIFGIMSLVSVGLIVATRTTSKELADGVLNFISWPMMFLSEVWFSLESASEEIVFISKLFPLTHMVQGIRKVMIDGLGFQAIYGHLLAMGAITIFFMSISAFLFKWSED